MKQLTSLLTKYATKWQLYALVFLGLLTYVYSDLLAHFDTALMDRLDYPYIVWVIKGNIDSLVSGNFGNYFATKGFYPHPYGLLFSDILLPQALGVLPLYLLTGKIILSFNVIYIATYVLNYASAFLLWKHFFKNSFVAFIGAILVVFGPFYHMQVGHFQMQSYWIGLFALLLMFRVVDELAYAKAPTSSQTLKPYLVKAGIAGLVLGIQFTASVYTYIFLSACSFIVWSVSIHMAPRKQAQHIACALSMYGVMALTIAPFVKAYYMMKDYYGMKREIAEIILYAAHVSDYMFTSAYTSLFYRLPLWGFWNQFDKHVIGEKAVFPGFFLMVFACIGLFIIIRGTKDKPISISLPLDRMTIIWLLTGIAGFVGSFGPRLSFNGTYAHIPTPYLAGLKLLPMLDGIRSPTRWEFLLILSLTYLSLKGLQKFSGHSFFKADSVRVIFGLLLLGWVLFEYLPRPVSTYTIPELSTQHSILKERCQHDDKTVVLEYPITHFNAYGGIVEGLGYISSKQFAQVLHECNLMNGYSGFIPDQVFELENAMNGLVTAADVDKLHSYLKNQNVHIVIFNRPNTLLEYRRGYDMLMDKLEDDTRFLKLSKDMFEVN